MYKVRPVQTKEKQEKLCAVCKVEYNADYFAYEAVTGDEELIGMCQFSLDNEAGHIHDLVYAPDSDDFEAMYIMGRATLNFIDLCGIKKAYYEGEENRLVRAVGFKPDESGRLFVDLEGFFEHHCGGDPQNK